MSEQLKSVTVDDGYDNQVEVAYTTREDGSVRVVSAGIVNDVHLDADELVSLGLMDYFTKKVTEKRKSV